MNLKDLLKCEEKVFFSVSLQDRENFLKFAKENGCMWLNGKEIDPLQDGCNGYMSIHSDLRIANVPYFAWNHPQTKDVIKYNFSNYYRNINEKSNCED